jgi:hypothetical protein
MDCVSIPPIWKNSRLWHSQGGSAYSIRCSVHEGIESSSSSAEGNELCAPALVTAREPA